MSGCIAQRVVQQAAKQQVERFLLYGMGKDSNASHHTVTVHASPKFRQTELDDARLQFVAWLAMPKQARSPKTQAELATLLGVSLYTLSRWAQDPRVQDAVRYMVLAEAGSPERVSTVLDVLYAQVADCDLPSKERRDAAKIWLEHVGVKETWRRPNTVIEIDNSQIVDVEAMSDAELAELYERSVAAQLENDAIKRSRVALDAPRILENEDS